jgi:hypothetical protein
MKDRLKLSEVIFILRLVVLKLSIRGDKFLLMTVYVHKCFTCNKCDRPFPSNSYYEYEGKAYCQEHYNAIMNSICSFCYQIASGKIVEALGHTWCSDHFNCWGCHASLVVGTRTKFVDWDHKLFCVACFKSLPGKTKEKLHIYTKQKVK